MNNNNIIIIYLIIIIINNKMNLKYNNNNNLPDVNDILLFNNNNNFDIEKFIINLLDNNNNISWMVYYTDIYKIKNDIDINVILKIITDKIDKIINNNNDHFVIIYNIILNINDILNIFNYDYIVDHNISFLNNFKIIKTYLILYYITMLKDNKKLNIWMTNLIKKTSIQKKYWNILIKELLIIKKFIEPKIIDEYKKKLNENIILLFNKYI